MFLLKTTHTSLMEIQQLKHQMELQVAKTAAVNFESQLIYLKNLLAAEQKQHTGSLEALHRSQELLKSRDNNLSLLIMQLENLLKENKSKSDELALLHRAKRVRTEAAPVVEEAPDPLLAPDVIVTEEGAQGTLRASQVKNINELRAELERQLNELVPDVDINKITPEAMAEAVITSEEEWKEKHREPDQDN